MIATLLVAAALGAAPPDAHPCRTPLPHGPAVPSPIVLWTSCGGFRLAPDGRVSRLPRRWLAKQGSGTGRRYGAHPRDPPQPQRTLSPSTTRPRRLALDRSLPRRRG